MECSPFGYTKSPRSSQPRSSGARDGARRAWLGSVAAVVVLFCLPAASQAEDEICIACEADRGALERISQDTWRALERGEVVVDHDRAEDAAGGEGGVARARAVLSHPAATLWRVLTTFESWPRFMPTIREVEVLRREGNQVWLRNHLRILWVDIQSHPMYVLHPRQGRITWRLDPTREQEFDRVEGVWQIVPLESGDGCLAEYRVLLDSGRWIPGFVEEMLTRRSLPDLLRSLDREAAAQTTGTLIPGRRSDRSPR